MSDEDRTVQARRGCSRIVDALLDILQLALCVLLLKLRICVLLLLSLFHQGFDLVDLISETLDVFVHS